MNTLTLCINLSDIYVCFFFIDKYFERGTRNAMNLRKKMSTKLVVRDSKAI